MYFDRLWFEEMFRKIMERPDRIDEKLAAKKNVVHPLDPEGHDPPTFGL